MNLLEGNLGIGGVFIGIFLLGTLISLCGKARDPGGGGSGKERRRRTQSRAAPQTKDIKKRIQNERAQLERSSRNEGEEQSGGVGTGSHASDQQQSQSSGAGSEKESNLLTPLPKPAIEKEVQMISERVPTKDEKAPSRDEKEKEGPSQSGKSSAAATSGAATSGAQPTPTDTVKVAPATKDGADQQQKEESDSEESDEESVKKSKKKKKKKHSKKKSKKRSSKKKSSKKEKKREKKTYFDQSKDNNSLDKPEKIVYPYALVPAKKQKTTRTVEKGLTTRINDLMMTTENNEQQQLEEAETQMMSGQTNAPNPSESSKVMKLDKTQALSLRKTKEAKSNRLDPTQNPSETKCLTGLEALDNNINNNGYEELPLLSVQGPPGDGEDGTPHEETAAASTNKTSAEKVSSKKGKVLMATLGPAEGAEGSEKKPKKSPIEPCDPKLGGSLRIASTWKSVNTTQTQQATELQTGVAEGGERISMVQETQPTTTKICTKSTMQSFPNSSDVVLPGVDATQPSQTRDQQQQAALLAPQVFPKGAKAERISKLNLRRGPAEYPTGSDIKSDWTPTSGSGGVQNAEEVDLRRSPVAKNDPRVPRVIPKSAKAERIAQYGLQKGGAEYPTFGDIRSDWTSTEGAAVPSKYKGENDYTRFENDPTKKKAAAASEKKSKLEKEVGSLKQSKREKDPSEKKMKKKASPIAESSPTPAPPPAQVIDPKLQEEERIKKLRAAAPKPKKFTRTPYEEKIAQGIIVRKKQDYPTMGDVISDWESENSSNSQMDQHQQHPQEHHHHQGGAAAAKTPKKAKDSDKQQ